MKYCLLGMLLSLSVVALVFGEGIPTRSKEASPEIKEAIDQLNADVKAWNARCAITNSDAEQKSCEEERVALEARKVSIRNGVVPSSSASKTLYPTVDVTLRYATKGKILKRVQTDSTGHFNLGTVPASTYIMEFRARKAAGLENQRFAIQVDGIKAYGKQGGILAKYLLGGFGVDVETTPGTPVKGQVATGSLAATKKMIWIPPSVASNFRGYWAEEGSGLAVAGAGRTHIPLSTIQRMQDHGDR